MNLFDKNDVQIESFPYDIHHTDREAPELACPRCGHVQPRRKRQVCGGCNHLIPVEKSRQSWTNLPTAKDSYRKMAQVFFDEGKTREFKSSRGNFGWKLFIRNVFVTFFVAALVMVPTVFGLKAWVGEKDWKKVESKFDAIIGPGFHRINTAPEATQKTASKPAHKNKVAKRSRSKRAH